MGFSSIDDLVNEITSNGKSLKFLYQKTSTNAAAAVAGHWHETYQWNGIPVAGLVTGTAGTAVQMNSTRQGAPYIGADVTPDTRHLLNLIMYTPTTTICPATLMLCDFLVIYPSLVVTGTPTTLTPTTLPRYTDGKGVMGIVSVVSALGAAAPALTFSYTDQDDGASVATAITSPVVSAALSKLFLVDGSPFIRIANGDVGIKTLTSYTLATGTTGTVSAFLVKPLANIPLLALNTASERDFLYQLPSLPRIYDGACLGFLVCVGGAMIASALLNGQGDLAWG